MQEQLSSRKLSIFNLIVFQELKVIIINSSLVNPLTLLGIASSQFSTVEEQSSSLAWKCLDRHAFFSAF